MTIKKLLIEMPNLIFKKTIIIFLFGMVFCQIHAQVHRSELKGNIKIKSSSLSKAVNGFYSYVTDKKEGEFNSSKFYVRVSLSATNDSTDFIEMSLYSYAITNQESKPNGFYGYLKKGRIYFVFDNQNKLITKNSKIVNPKLFNSIKTSKKKYPKPTYDPYKWEFIICNNNIITKSPPEIIDKYVSLN
jgi:hypothetical protein